MSPRALATTRMFSQWLAEAFESAPQTTTECADDLWRVLQDMGLDASGNECRRVVDFVRNWQPALARTGF